MLLNDFFISERRKELSSSKKSDVERGEILLFLLILERTGLTPLRDTGGKSLPTAVCMVVESASLLSAFSFKP